MISYNGESDPKEQALFSFKFNPDEIRLEPQSFDFASEKSCWIIAKNQNNRLKGHQYHLLEGDYIKLGRVFFRIKEINLNKPQLEEYLPIKYSNDISPCRICLSDCYEDDDPLITPCKCLGSLKYIHLRCLKEWLNSKVTMKFTESYTYISWDKLECELCKSPFPC